MFVWPSIVDERTMCHVTQPCEECGTVSDEELRRIKRDLTFYWFVWWRWSWVTFPLVTVSVTYGLECSVCRHLRKVPKETAEAMIRASVAATSSKFQTIGGSYDWAGVGPPDPVPTAPPPAPSAVVWPQGDPWE